MPSILKMKQVFTNNLKCISDDGKWAGGATGTVKNIVDELEISTGSSVNSMASYGNGLVFGLYDGRLGMLNEQNKEEYVSIHTANICNIDTLNGYILTGSWDHFAVLLVPTTKDRADIHLNGNYYTKKVFHHPETVWKVMLIDENTFITGCADTKIRIYKDCSMFKEIAYHSHVVRSILIENNGDIPSFIYSIDNYGVLIKTAVNGNIIASRNLDEMCFSMCWCGEDIVVAGEGGNIFVIKKDLTVQSRTKLPCPTCWSVRTVDDSIFVAGSDGVLYQLSTNDLYNSVDCNELDNEFNNGLNNESNSEFNHESNNNSNSESNSKSNSESNTKYYSKSDSGENRVFFSNGSRYKIENGKVYLDTGSSWELVGDNSNQKSFTVELEDKKYTLSFNEDENPSEVASRFIHQNKINPVHHQEIVDYINQNFRRDKVFRRYEKIDIDGISKVLGDHPVIKIIREISAGQKYSILKSDEKNVYEIEQVLHTIEKDKFFVCLDICKYLFAKKIWIDFSFLFNCKITNKKEAKAFIFLLTNMIENPPFSMVKFNFEIRRLIDQRLLTLDDTLNYEENWAIKSRLNK